MGVIGRGGRGTVGGLRHPVLRSSAPMTRLRCAVIHNPNMTWVGVLRMLVLWTPRRRGVRTTAMKKYLQLLAGAAVGAVLLTSCPSPDG